MLPIQGKRPVLVAKPVANVVYIASVDHDTDAAFQKIRQFGVVVLHKVVLEHLVHSEIATRPLLRRTDRLLHFWGVQESLHTAEIIAKWRLLALDAHVIG